MELADLRIEHRVDAFGYRAPDLVRFLRRVEQDGDCWRWAGRIGTAGYGTFTNHGVVHRAHRYAYQTLVGPIPDGLVLDHLCRNRACVRPSHLEPVTCRENLLRGETFQAANAAKTHCPQGHAYDEANTRLKRGVSRVCRTCHRINERRRVKQAV